METEIVVSEKEIYETFKKWYNVYGQIPNTYNMNIAGIVNDEKYAKASTEWFIKMLNGVKSEKN